MQYEEFDKDELVKILYEKDKYIDKLVKKNKQLNYYATMDAMTSVINRSAGMKILNEKMKIAKFKKENLVIGFIDIDELKKVNDKFGHKEGDSLLINICKIIRRNIRKDDIIFRIGGDEFIIILPFITMRKVQEICDGIYKTIDGINKSKIYKYCLGISCGFVEYSYMENIDADELISRADEKMYRNKLR